MGAILAPRGSRDRSLLIVPSLEEGPSVRDSAAFQGRQQLLREAITHADALKRYLRRRTDPVEVEDLMQEVYLAILKARSQDNIKSPKAYVFRIAASIAHQHRSRRAAEHERLVFEDPANATAISDAQESDANSPEQAAAFDECLAALSERLGSLSPRVQAAILWHHRDGYTCDEIAEKLSVITHRVKKYLVKGLAHCRTAPIAERA
jgi:RNA polymerase sigma-70 factor (ECF subfamily)